MSSLNEYINLADKFNKIWTKLNKKLTKIDNNK